MDYEPDWEEMAAMAALAEMIADDEAERIRLEMDQERQEEENTDY
jgi:hypothetical protein